MLQGYGEELIRDDLGIQSPPQCHDCCNCPKCQKSDVEISKKDREVLASVRDSLEEYNEVCQDSIVKSTVAELIESDVGH